MVAYLRAANVKDGRLDLTDVKEMNFDPREQATFGLKPGDVLVTEGSGSLRAVGASAVWRGELDHTVCFQNTLLRLRPRPGTDARFLGWWCRHAYADGLFASIAAGANIFHIAAERVRALRVTYLDEQTQRLIADFLDVESARIDALIARKRRMVELLGTRYAQAATERIFGSIASEEARLPPVTRPQPVLQFYLGSAPQRWAVVPFRRIATLSSRVNQRGAAQVLSLTIGGLTVPRPPDRQPPSQDYLLRYNLVEPGQLVVNPMWLVGGSIGVSTLHGAVSPDYRVYNLSSLVLPAYIHHLLRSAPYRDQYRLLTRAETTFDRRVTKDDFHELLVPIPPISEQQQIVSRLDQIEADLAPLSERLTRQVDLLTEHRQALITSAVTGDLVVPGVAA